jgi:hypothetical protein
MTSKVQTVGWREVLDASRPAPVPLDRLRPIAWTALVAACLEAAFATVLGNVLTSEARAPLGPPDPWYAEPYRWISSHFVGWAAAGLTIEHSGGQIWGPVIAGIFVMALVISALMTRGWTSGRPVGTSLLALGTIGAGASGLPLVFTAMVSIMTLIGYAAWSVVLPLIFVVIAIVYLIIGVLILIMGFMALGEINK